MTRVPQLCGACNGLGQTRETRTVMRNPWAKRGKPETVEQGSGCPVCLGTGVVDPNVKFLRRKGNGQCSG